MRVAFDLARAVKTFLYLLLRSWANGKNPQVMISFENVPMRSLANENSRSFPFFFFPSHSPLRISTSELARRFAFIARKDFYNDPEKLRRAAASFIIATLLFFRSYPSINQKAIVVSRWAIYVITRKPRQHCSLLCGFKCYSTSVCGGSPTQK